MQYVEKMEKALETTQREFTKVRAGTANAAMLDGVRIDYYGTPTPVPHVATVAVPEPRTIVISPYERNMLDAIEKALLQSNLGLTPMKDGHSIRINLPILTAERRQELVKVVRKIAEDGRVAVRNIRREANDHFKKVAKDDDRPEDELKKQMDDVQKNTDKFIARIDAVAKGKEDDLLKV